MDFKEKKIAILGLGIEGIALAQFLQGKCKEIFLLDQFDEGTLLQNSEGKLKDIFVDKNIKRIFGEKYLENLDQFDLVFRSPGISYFNEKIQEARKSGVEFSSQIKLFFELCPCPIIGVTGTKGKGTTASLIFEILKKQSLVESHQSTAGGKPPTANRQPQVYLAGNIGYPAVSLIEQLKKDDLVVLELSSFQLMDLESSPHIAVVVNLLEDHLNYHKDIDEYRESKFNILKYQEEGDVAVLNADSTFDKEEIDITKSQKLYFSKTEARDAFLRKTSAGYDVILSSGGDEIKICDDKSIKLFGKHNLENIAAAALVANALKVPEKIIKETVSGFSGLEHRLEFVAEIDGVKYINDSFATNPEPTMAAIDSFSEDKILILGGSSKGADFSGLSEKVSSSNVKAIILIGDEAEKIKASLLRNQFSGKIFEGAKNIEEVVKKAHKISQKNNVVILSPACASFGMFKNYKDRGKKFKDAVHELEAGSKNLA